MAERWNPLRRFLYLACGAALGVALAVPFTGIGPLGAGWPSGRDLLVLVGSGLLVGTVSALVGDRFWESVTRAARWVFPGWDSHR